MKVGHPDAASISSAWRGARDASATDAPLMVDANQQWDRATALRMGRALRGVRPDLDRRTARRLGRRGHAALAAALDTPIATGEMLTSAPSTRACSIAARPTSCNPTHRASAASPRSCGFAALGRPAGRAAGPALRDGDPHPPRRRLPGSNRGSSTSTGSNRSSTRTATSTTGACGCRSARSRFHTECEDAGADAGYRGIRLSLRRPGDHFARPRRR